MTQHIGGLLSAWGKARPAGDTSQQHWHPLVYHCLDVAAVGRLLVRDRPNLTSRLARSLGWPPSAFDRLFVFLLALHDIGKLSRPFQSKVSERWPVGLLGPLPEVLPRDPGHTTTGALLLQEVLAAEVASLFPSWGGNRIEALCAPFVGHHGRPVASANISKVEMFGEAGQDAARVFFGAMRELFAPEPVPRPDSKVLKRVSWPLAGLAVLADWIGSNQSWFPYTPPERAPAEYLERLARPRAAEALRAAGIGPARISSTTGFAALTGASHAPTAMQIWAQEVTLPAGPSVTFIEDVTGSGKTEAALILAHRLMAAGRARGLYVALPTMATANAMWARLAACYRRLFASGETPSLALAHGNVWLHQGFRESFADVADPTRANEPEEESESDSGAACAAWLADSRRKAFLADVGVGTIDQAFLAVLPAKYQSLRLLGLAERVLIVDEAHAYDAYMGHELERLLSFQAALGGSAIVLSATLPRTVRERLANAFSAGLGAPPPTLRGDAYPLVSMISARGTLEEGKQARADLCRELAIQRLPDARSAVARIAEAAASGAAVAWVRNTVDDALDGLADLAAAGVPATLFHARFAMGDRLVIEQDVVRRFGKGNPGDRSGVLVATQVIEQSLDLDFDLMVTDLAPVDLMLQRAGRLWRHPGRLRPLPGPRLLTVSPEPSVEADAEWYLRAFARAGWVYRNHALVWLSARTLLTRDRLRVPDGVRGLVEDVYGACAAEAPPALERNWTEATGTEQAHRSLAEANLLDVWRGYGGEHSGWDIDTRIPTRIGEAMTTLRLAKVEGDRLIPWCHDPDPRLAWALSEVTVRRNRAHNVPAPPANLRQAVDDAGASWTRHDEAKPLLPLIERSPGRWSGTVLDKDGPKTVTYNRREGLRFE
jgi:CRISPR-associated endonuclease/helicase Cas3